MGKRATEHQIEWWYKKREIVTNSLVKTSDMNIARVLAENLKYIDGKITELELKQMKRRKVGKFNG